MKKWLRESVLTRGLYQKLKEERDKRQYKAATETEHRFTDRRVNSKKLCLILAGYKPFLYKDVFGRLSRFKPEDVEVCIVSSGIYSDILEDIAQQYGWSYLSTKRNCVTLAQNVAILKYPEAEYIYKIDEDIFVTKNSFESMMETYERVEAAGEYEVGFVAPLIPINGYGHLRILKRLDLTELYQEKFERPIYASYGDRMIEKNPETAKFFWGEGGYVPSIDHMSQRFSEEEFQYSACPVRFSIGFILMKRSLWENMGMWKVLPDTPCMGLDEEQICSYCIVHSKAVIVDENTVAGHLSFGGQNALMKEYYLQNPDYFACPEE